MTMRHPYRPHLSDFLTIDTFLLIFFFSFFSDAFFRFFLSLIHNSVSFFIESFRFLLHLMFFFSLIFRMLIFFLLNFPSILYSDSFIPSYLLLTDSSLDFFLPLRLLPTESFFPRFYLLILSNFVSCSPYLHDLEFVSRQSKLITVRAWRLLVQINPTAKLVLLDFQEERTDFVNKYNTDSVLLLNKILSLYCYNNRRQFVNFHKISLIS